MESKSTETIFADQLNDLVVTRLLLQMEGIEQWGTGKDVDQYDNLSQTIAYIANQETLEELSTRDVPTKWVDIMVAQGKKDKAVA